MEPTTTETLVAQLRAVRDEVQEPWEQTVIDLGLAVLTRGGTPALMSLYTDLTTYLNAPGKKDLTEMVGRSLTLWEASDLLVVLENGEADRHSQTLILLNKVLKAALLVANELLKLALVSS